MKLRSCVRNNVCEHSMVRFVNYIGKVGVLDFRLHIVELSMLEMEICTFINEIISIWNRK